MLVNIGKHLRKVTEYIYFKVIMDRITLKLLNVDEVNLMAIRIKSILKTIAFTIQREYLTIFVQLSKQ